MIPPLKQHDRVYFSENSMQSMLERSFTSIPVAHEWYDFLQISNTTGLAEFRSEADWRIRVDVPLDLPIMRSFLCGGY